MYKTTYLFSCSVTLTEIFAPQQTHNLMHNNEFKLYLPTPNTEQGSIWFRGTKH